MVRQIEGQIRDLQMDLIEVQRERTPLRIQPYKGDRELRRKEGKLEELDERIRTLRESIREPERKRQEVLFVTFKKEGCQPPFFNQLNRPWMRAAFSGDGGSRFLFHFWGLHGETFHGINLGKYMRTHFF
jgi:hypothetical protein